MALELREAARVLAHRDQQCVFVSEMPEQCRLVDARTFGDFARRRSTRTILLVNFLGREQDTRTRIFSGRTGPCSSQH